MEQCPKSKLRLSLRVPKHTEEDRGGEEGVHSSSVPSGHKWWGCSGLEGLGLLLSSQMKLLQKLSSFLDNLPPLHAVQPPLSQAALHTEVCKKTSTDLIIYPRYFYGKTLRVMNLALSKALRDACYYCSLILEEQQQRTALFGEASGTGDHTSQFKQCSFVRAVWKDEKALDCPSGERDITKGVE